MKTDNIHKSIKDSLKNDVDRKAPQRLRMSIMDQVMKIHASKFHVPSYNGLAVVGLFICALLIALPTFLPDGTNVQPALSLDLPTLNIPTWLWFSICAGLSLLAADSLINQRLKNHNLQGKKHH